MNDSRTMSCRDEILHVRSENWKSVGWTRVRQGSEGKKFNRRGPRGTVAEATEGKSELASFAGNYFNDGFLSGDRVARQALGP